MITELKEAADKWFGDNGDDLQEAEFLKGWVQWEQYLDQGGHDANVLAGRAARIKYEAN